MVSRRQFLWGNFKGGKAPQRPPWALAETVFPDVCTRCGACAPVCPTRIIIIVRGYPEVDFRRGECTFCGACAAVCKDQALLHTEKGRHAKPWTIKAQISDRCATRQGVACRVCDDRCQVAAIRFSPRLGAPPMAEIDATLCTGCGACLAPCPMKAISLA
ncbi:MAG: ferredoxin-type protein NapF [Sulfuritalea sp.]|jgi:ferredoxin-type protein NapF|nr:ferredoxin-type protein NapF [Sulfuritalea sp.]